jgi:RNA polymerase sigma-70 factor (ECF subfamily)
VPNSGVTCAPRSKLAWLTGDPDFELLERWRGGDAAAGQELFARQFAGLYRFFATKCDGDTDELVQATLVACLKAKETFRAESSFRGYLFTVARNELYRYFRERQRTQALDFSLSSVADLATTPGTRIARDQDHRILLDALRTLPVEQQTLLELYYWEELDIDTLASIFEAPPPTIRTWLYRARQTLKTKIGNENAVQEETLKRGAP